MSRDTTQAPTRLPRRDFIWTVEYIRRVGYEERFIGRVWTYLDVGEHQYWDCGGDVRSADPKTGVGLINRALLVRPEVEVLQTGFTPRVPINQINNLRGSFGNSRPFALATITSFTLDHLATGQVWGKWATAR